LTPKLTLETLHDEIRGHGGCGFEPCETATNMVPGEGSATAEVMLVGEAPGASEDRQGRPFVGRAGKLLDELLGEAGLERSDVYITNVLKARPPDNRDPRADEVAHSMPWLEQQLALIQPKLVVPLGRHALAHFAPEAKISEVHGQLLVPRERALFPMYHPAAALHAKGLRETLFDDARRLPAALAEVRSGKAQ
jgi:uracil-DNA glycosylase